MNDSLNLDANFDDQQLLAQVIDYYQQTLKQNPNALAYLQHRGITNSEAIDHFRIGFADRSLGKLLPTKDSKTGRDIRSHLEALGLFRQSGHEHFVGSITFPILAAEGSGRIVDVYGRKVLGYKLRKGTLIHTHLNDKGEGVWNIEAFGAVDEIVLCGSLWDALTFWNHGYRNATTMFGQDALTADLLEAFREFRLKRVLTPCEAVTARLLETGLEVFLIKLPQGVDLNAYACQVDDAADALGSLLRRAEWIGKPSSGTTVPPEPIRPAITPSEQTDDEKNEPDDVQHEQADIPIRTASPLPPAPQDLEADIKDDEVVLHFGNRRYRIRGWAKNLSFDQLKANVMVHNGVGLFVDTLDIYSAKHRRAFTSQAATELAVEEQTIKKELGQVLLKLEELQDQHIAATLQPQQTLPSMSEQEKTEALRLLRDPHLMDRIVNDFAVVGERTNKLVGYLAAVSRKLDQPLAVLIQSTTAAGKTTLMEAILSFMPPEDVVKFTAMTGQSLYYMGEQSLQHKILALVEEEGTQRASYALKLLQSEGELRIASTGKEATTGRLVTQEYRVEGPVMILLTTTSMQVDEELLNRCLVLTVDEERHQTRQIHQLQRQQQTLQGQLATRAQQETLKLHRNAQRLLRPLLVANPYAEQLTFADSKTRTRRDHVKYLTLIRAITLLHQHQRTIQTIEHQGQQVEYIEVTADDIALANQLAQDVLGRSLDDLPPQTRRLLDLLDEMVGEACQSLGVDRADYRFSRRQVREHTSWGHSQLAVHLRRLEELEYLLIHHSRGRAIVYELAYTRPSSDGRFLPGLLDADQLRRHLPGSSNNHPESDRPHSGPIPGHFRPAASDATPRSNSSLQQ